MKSQKPPRSTRRGRVIAAALLTTSVSFGVLAQPAATHAATNGSPSDALRGILEEMRARMQLPSLAAGYTIGDDVMEYAATGYRNWGSPDKVTDEDIYHIGSNTKSVNSVILAKLVELGKFSFDSKLPALLPDISMRPEFNDVTLAMLASHRSGIQGTLYSPDLPAGIVPPAGTVATQQQRTDYVKFWLNRAPVSTPGTKYEYSAAGTIVAAHIAERATGKTWEQLVNEYVFGPLGMTSCSLGTFWPSATVQPNAHRWQGNTPVPQALGYGNLRINDGSDQIRCSMKDLLKYVRAQAVGEAEGGILSKESWKNLHTPRWPQDRYGFNLQNAPAQPWTGGSLAFFHTGSNTGNYALMAFAPGSQTAFFITTNIGSTIEQNTLNKTDSLMTEVLQRLVAIASTRQASPPKQAPESPATVAPTSTTTAASVPTTTVKKATPKKKSNRKR